MKEGCRNRKTERGGGGANTGHFSYKHVTSVGMLIVKPLCNNTELIVS